MSGIVGIGGTESGSVSENFEALHCSCHLSANLSINNGSGWYLPDANQVEATHDPNGWWDDTNRRILPTKRGIYYIYGHSYLGNCESGYLFGHLFNYVGIQGTFNMHTFAYSSLTNDCFAHSHHVLLFDGVDDYISAPKYHYSHGSTARNVVAGINNTNFGITYLGERFV